MHNFKRIKMLPCQLLFVILTETKSKKSEVSTFFEHQLNGKKVLIHLSILELKSSENGGEKKKIIAIKST